MFVDLVMDNGGLVRIECPDEFMDQLYEALDNSMKRGDQWSPAMFDGCSAEYMGLSLDRVNMGKIMGLL